MMQAKVGTLKGYTLSCNNSIRELFVSIYTPSRGWQEAYRTLETNEELKKNSLLLNIIFVHI